jgi:hypothetical protein
VALAFYDEQFAADFAGQVFGVLQRAVWVIVGMEKDELFGFLFDSFKIERLGEKLAQRVPAEVFSSSGKAFSKPRMATAPDECPTIMVSSLSLKSLLPRINWLYRSMFGLSAPGKSGNQTS